MEPHTFIKKDRIYAIETFRVFGIIAVICLHANPFVAVSKQYICFKYLPALLDNFCRFAVPFFFIASGYFFGVKIRMQSVRVKAFNLLLVYVKRLLVIFLSWSAIYFLLNRYVTKITHRSGGFFQHISSSLSSDAPDRLHWLLKTLVKFIQVGGSDHLWFITALMLALVMVTCIYVLNKEKYLLVFSSLLYVFGLFSRVGYVSTPLGIHLPSILDTRNGPFVSMIFVSVGFLFAIKNMPLIKARYALAIIAISFLLQEVEVYWLCKVYHTVPRFECLFATVPFGVGVFLLALSKPSLGKSTILPRLGVFVLGVYVSHILILRLYPKWIPGFFPEIPWQMLYPIQIFALSAAFVYILKKIPLIKAIVT